MTSSNRPGEGALRVHLAQRSADERLAAVAEAIEGNAVNGPWARIEDEQLRDLVGAYAADAMRHTARAGGLDEAAAVANSMAPPVLQTSLAGWVAKPPLRALAGTWLRRGGVAEAAAEVEPDDDREDAPDEMGSTALLTEADVLRTVARELSAALRAIGSGAAGDDRD